MGVSTISLEGEFTPLTSLKMNVGFECVRPPNEERLVMCPVAIAVISSRPIERASFGVYSERTYLALTEPRVMIVEVLVHILPFTTLVVP